ncbi:MAG TPA: patatin-like phospholipase family protein [Gemmatimonadaceae bacterium]|nr:patatin-like phospholipase family protein [Gemmatimonadaceae bacterium]
MTDPRLDAALSPVESPEPEEEAQRLAGIGLCLSGGGYRAMVFHLGALWRINELGLLPKLARISSVSGGSITAGVLAHRWRALDFDSTGVARRFVPEVVDRVRRLAGVTIDARSIIGGLLFPGSISDRIAGAYDEHLFEGATLRDLPDEPPRFTINATNVQSGALWRFSKHEMRDWRVGNFPEPSTRLAVAVAASSAFPPVLSPSELRPAAPPRQPPPRGADLGFPPYTTEIVLSDGGVYDNLGLETVWKRCAAVLVSDAGGKMKPDPSPKRDWARHSMRILDLIDNQVRSLRKRQLIASYVAGKREGAYWSVRTQIADYGLANPLPCPPERTAELAAIETRLAAMSADTQQRLINWGYAVCDAAIRAHYLRDAAPPGGFPYARTKV